MSDLRAMKPSTQYCLEHIAQQPHCIHEEVDAQKFSAARMVCKSVTVATAVLVTVMLRRIPCCLSHITFSAQVTSEGK